MKKWQSLKRRTIAIPKVFEFWKENIAIIRFLTRKNLISRADSLLVITIDV